MLPKDVSLHVTRIPMENATYDKILHLADDIGNSARLLADIKGLNVIGFACTIGGFIRGKGYDQEIIDKIIRVTGVPATTMATAVVEALRTLGIKKLVLSTPYMEQITSLEKNFLEAKGFQILSYKFLGLEDITKQYEVAPEEWYRRIKQMQVPGADGYFLSCGGIRVVGIIEKLEAELKKSVITSNQALLWHCLRKAGYQKSLEGFGCLMRAYL